MRRSTRRQGEESIGWLNVTRS